MSDNNPSTAGGRYRNRRGKYQGVKATHGLLKSYARLG